MADRARFSPALAWTHRCRHLLRLAHLSVSHPASAPGTPQRRARPAPGRGLGPSGPRLWLARGRRRGELAARGDAELAVDVARVRADRLDAHPAGRARSARSSRPAAAAAAPRPRACSASPPRQPGRHPRPAPAAGARGSTCSPREARWIALITSRDCVSLPRQALAPNASSCAHSIGAGSSSDQDQSRRRMVAR